MDKSESKDTRDLETFGTYKPIMALNKDSFKEMQRFFVIKIIADNPEGITAYQLSTDYFINRSTVKLMLKEFEQEKFVETKTEIIDGRNNKFYLLTQLGFDYLLQLKYTWFERFSMMEELTLRNLTNSEKKLYIKKIDSYESKEEQLDYLRAMQTRHKNNMQIYKRKYETFAQMDDILTHIIGNIEKEDYLDRKELEHFFDLVIDME